MEEEKAAAYYEELTRKGEGAARFKQGLGFSSTAVSNEAIPARGLAIPSSSSSFLGQFVRASSPASTAKLEKESEIQSVRDKLKKKPEDRQQQQPRVSDRNAKESSERRCSRSRERDERERRHRRRSRSRSKDKYVRDRRHGRRSRSRERHRDRGTERRSRRSRSLSPRRERRKSDDERRGGKRDDGKEERGGKVDYSRLINGYDEMVRLSLLDPFVMIFFSSRLEKSDSIRFFHFGSGDVD